MKSEANDPIEPAPGQVATDHIPLHRLWSFARIPGQLDTPGQAHVRECQECRNAFQLCLRSDNFGVVLKELNQERDALGPDGRPKLKKLYVVPGARKIL